MLSKYAEQLTTAKRNFILGLVTDIEERNEYNSYDTFPFGEKGKRNTLDNQRRFNINLREPTRGDVSLQPHFLRDQLENRFAADREAWLSVPELQQQQQQYQNPKHPNSVNISSSADEVAAGSANTTAITAGGPSNVSSIEHHHSVTFASGHVAAPYPNIMSDSQQREEHGGYGNNINNNVFLHPCSAPTGGAADGEVVCLPLPSYASKLGGQVSTLRKEVKHLTEMLIEGYGADFFAELLIGTEYHPSNRGRVSLLKGQGEAVGVTSSAQAELVRGGLGTHGNEAPANAHFLLTQYRNFMAARDEEERIIEKEIRADMTIKRLSSLSGIHLRACERAKEMMANGGIAAFQRQQRINTPSEDTSDNDNSMETTASYGKQKIKESTEQRKLGREAPTYYGTNKTPRATFVSDDKETMLIEGVKSAADCMVPAVDIIRAQILLSHILQAAEKHDEDAHAAVEAAKRSDVLVTEEPAVVIDEKRGDSDEERYRKGVDQYRSKVQSKKRKGEGRSGEGQELDGDTYNDEEEEDDDDDDIVPKAARAPRYRNTKNVDSSYRAVDQWRRGNKNPSRKSCRINDDDEQDSDSESDNSDDIHVKREKWESTKQREKGKKKDSKKVPTLLTSLQKDSSSTTISSILKGARAVRNSNTVTSNDSSGVIALDNRNRTSPTGDSSLSPDGRQTASSFSRTDSEKTKMNSKSNNRDALNKLNNSNNYNNNSQFLEQGNDSIFAGNQSGTLLRGDRSKGPRSNQDNTTTTSSSVVGFVDDIDIERQKGDKRNSSYRSHDGSNINANRISNSSSSTPGSNAKKSDSSRNINSSDTLSCGPPVVRSGWSNSCGNMLTKEDNQGAKEKKNRDNNNTYGKKNSAKSTSFERRCSTESSSSDSDIDPTAASRRMAETGVLESVQEITAGSSSDDSETSGGRERERETTSRKSWNQSNNQGSRRSSVRTKSEDGEEKKSKRKFPKIKIPKFKLPEYKLPKLKLPKKLPFKIPSWPKSFCTGRKDGVVER